MAKHSGQDPSSAAHARPALPPLRAVPSEELFRGAREIVIEHDGQQYRLRCTSNGKLILTK